ncbi:MAG: hypothetical protein L6U99_01015 [Clostridium sp.]|nr:MAG: hypothetical protein L6U99_01015 [Clostridium sp.]
MDKNTEIYLDKSYSTAVLNLSINDDASEPAFEFQLNGVKKFLILMFQVIMAHMILVMFHVKVLLKKWRLYFRTFFCIYKDDAITDLNVTERVNSYIYSGNEFTYVPVGYSKYFMRISNNSETNAGNYVANVSLKI